VRLEGGRNIAQLRRDCPSGTRAPRRRMRATRGGAEDGVQRRPTVCKWRERDHHRMCQTIRGAEAGAHRPASSAGAASEWSTVSERDRGCGKAVGNRRLRSGSLHEVHGTGVAVAALWVLALGFARVEPTGGEVITLADGTKQLTAPWTEVEHTTACPNSDPRPCPVLLLNNPAVSIRSQEAAVKLRNVATLSQDERDRGATVPFFVYNYKYNQVTGKQYRVYANGTDQYEITFTSMYGTTAYNVDEAAACGVVTDLDDTGVFSTIANADTGPLSFSVTATLPKINCFLGTVIFKKSGGKISSDMQLADEDIGAMSTLTIRIRTALGTTNTRSAYKVTTVINYESIMFQPKIKEGRCPSFSYPYPDMTQVPLPEAQLPPAAQPISIAAGWQRSQLPSGQGGLCMTRPINTYPGQMPTVIQCPRTLYSGNLSAPTCQACGVTSSDWFYVFEDAPTIMTLSNIKFEDGDFFYGSANMSLELIFDTHSPISQGLTPTLTAQPGSVSAFSYCAQTDVAARPCASERSETFNNIWVPAAGKAWGVNYKIRIVDSTSVAIFCTPGTTACPTTPSGGCEDPSDTDLATGAPMCPCKSGDRGKGSKAPEDSPWENE